MATGRAPGQILDVPSSTLAARPPFALGAPTFRFRALAALAARAPIGPARDVALAWYLCARLVEAAVASTLPAAARASRAAAARAWLASTAVPPACRVSLTRVVDLSSADDDGSSLARALADAIEATAEHLDAATRAELEPLLTA